jgi:hypothetical protein
MKKTHLFITLLLFILFGCTTHPLNVDVSSIETEPLQVLRLEADLFSLNAANFETRSKEIRSKYGSFYEHFLINPLRVNGVTDSLYKPLVLNFVSDKNVHDAYTYVKKLYPDPGLKEFTPEINEMVKHFKYHFPERKLPTRFITCTTGWNYAFAYMDSALVISLDMYLGDTAIFYQMLQYAQYQVRKMNRNYILPDIARGWMLTEFDKSMPENTLLNHTIFYGKQLYAMNALLPRTNDSLLVGYTTAQMNYCKEFEKKLWGYFAEENRLYENNMNIIRELTSDGPFTAAIHKDCPPRIAMWVGWQIVKSYMEKNKDVTLEQLMQDNDARKILTRSKYRP